LSLVLDTSAALAFLNRSEPNHGPVKSTLVSEPGQLIIPVGILAEIFYLIKLAWLAASLSTSSAMPSELWGMV